MGAKNGKGIGSENVQTEEKQIPYSQQTRQQGTTTPEECDGGGKEQI